MADTQFKKYKLMHKSIPVAAIELDEATATISSIHEIFSPEHVPVGIGIKKGQIDRGALNEWWRGRAIPASRDGIKNALEELHITSTQKLLDKCFGLSLSDQYWICPEKSELDWNKVNFFQNAFSDDVGNLLFGKKSDSKAISLISPDNTSDGWLRKKWAMIDGKRCLIKGGSGTVQQEPYNEVFASILMNRLGIPHVEYTLMMQEDYPYSVCEDFITTDTELISAWYVMQTAQKQNHVSVYQHYLNCCEMLGISAIKESLDQMIVLDYLIVNEDRHQNNFGVIRDANTLKWIGAAPIYDSGTSLWFDKPTGMLGSKAKVNCKPFKSSHEEQIKLVSDFSWLEFSALVGAEEEFRAIVKDSLFIDDARANAICKGIRDRINDLEQISKEEKIKIFVDNQAKDVISNIAYSGNGSE